MDLAVFRVQCLNALQYGLLLFLMGLFAIAMVAVAIGLPAMAIWNQQIIAALQEDGAPAHAYWILMGVVALAGVALYLAFLFVRHMKRIVDSVAEGDPFVPANAERLTAMAWLMLAIQILSIPIAAVGGIFAKETGQGLAFQTAASPPDLQDSPKSEQASGDRPSPPAGRGRFQVIKYNAADRCTPIIPPTPA